MSDPTEHPPEPESPPASRTIQKMPASIIKAISTIRMSMDAVAKTHQNQHGGYKFASTDDIYAATTRKMGEIGFHVHTLEEKCEIVRIEKDGKTSQWAHMIFSFILATEQDTWHDERDRRTLFIQITGAQTFHAGQSFAEKAYFRSLYKIPTGDMDLDSLPQAETEEDQIALAGSGKKRKSSAEGKRDGSVKRFNALRAAVQAAPTSQALVTIRTDNAEEWDTLPRGWAEMLEEEYEVKIMEFGRDLDAAE